MLITSRQNPQFKEWKKLHTARGRYKQRRYIIENYHLVEEAINHHAQIETIVIQESSSIPEHWKLSPSVKVFKISNLLAKELSQTESPQGVFAIVKMPSQVDYLPSGKRYLLVDAIQDPGNLGTLIRSAAAASYDMIVLGSNTVDLYNDKVIRATQGAIYQISIIEESLPKIIKILQSRNITVLATALNKEAKSYLDFKVKGGLAIIVGNEGKGVHPSLIKQADASIYIPMPGKVESLNVAVAGSILMFNYL